MKLLRNMIMSLALLLAFGCNLSDFLGPSGGGSGSSDSVGDNSGETQCDFKIASVIGDASSSVIATDGKSVDISMNAMGQMGLAKLNSALPDRNKRIFGVRVSNIVENGDVIVMGVTAFNDSVDWTDASTTQSTFSGNVVSIGAGFSQQEGAGGTGNNWNAISVNIASPDTFKPTTHLQNGDTLYLVIDGNSWYAYFDNNTLSEDFSSTANNGDHTIDMQNLAVFANTWNSGTTSASIKMELLTTKSEMLAAGLDVSGLPSGIQTLCDETF